MDQNPQNNNNLDPKLQEAYERVMGMAQNSQQIQTQPATPIQAVEQPQSTQPLPTTTPHQPITQMEQEIMSSPVARSNNYINPEQATEKITNDDSPVKPPQKDHKLISFILGLGVVLFLITYAIVWTKIFGLF